jgi:tRNA modification GTPase
MEDVVEIHCHGGIISVKKVLELVLLQGARLAEPGEFTKRAYLNGRLDLSQAEAVIDLIRSKSDRAFSIALKQVDGQLSKKIKALRQTLVETMAHIEVNIDYPEHDVEELTNLFIKAKCDAAVQTIDDLLRTAERGKILREGIQTAIIGKPNVGKSSLLNVLSQHERAIVTDVPGTTRDVIEEFVTIGGIPLKLLDTAGIRETTDLVERIGVERSHEAMDSADLILLVLNNNDELSADELGLIEKLRHRQTIIVINKIDLASWIDMRVLTQHFPMDRIVKLSAQQLTGIDELEQAIVSLFFSGSVSTDDLTYVSNVRHIHLLRTARNALVEALQGTALLIPIDMLQIDIRNAWEQLGEIIGDSVSDALIDTIFSQFCLGK